ncbi:MAG: hypothetical protein II325_06370 [Clostridia bacterium]|nr:hypothetical protein [Clostridia bacterium]
MKKIFKHLIPLLLLALCLAACAEETATTSDKEDTSVTASSQAQSLPEEASSEETSSEEPSTAESEPIAEESTDASTETSEPTESGTEEIPAATPEELYDLYKQAESSSFVMEIEIPGERIATAMLYYQDGNYHIISVMEAGTYTKMEYYLQKDGDTAYMYGKDDNGNWIREETEFPEDVVGIDGSLAPLFKNENYDLETMQMVDSFSIDIQHILFGGGSLECTNGTYAILAKDVEEDSGARLTISIYDLGKTTVTLPEVDG